MTIYDLLDRPIAFHAPLVDLTGSITAALMLSQAIYWSKRTKHDGGWFYKSREEWTEETRMSRDEQETARKKLRASGFWQERYDRVNHRKWYRVNQAALLAAIMALSEPKRDSRLASEGFPLSCNRAENTAKNTLTKEDIGVAEVDFLKKFRQNQSLIDEASRRSSNQSKCRTIHRSKSLTSSSNPNRSPALKRIGKIFTQTSAIGNGTTGVPRSTNGFQFVTGAATSPRWTARLRPQTRTGEPPTK